MQETLHPPEHPDWEVICNRNDPHPMEQPPIPIPILVPIYAFLLSVGVFAGLVWAAYKILHWAGIL